MTIRKHRLLRVALLPGLAIAVGLSGAHTHAAPPVPQLVGATSDVEHASGSTLAHGSITGHFNELGSVHGSVTESVADRMINGKSVPYLTLSIKLSVTKIDSLRIHAEGPAYDAEPGKNAGYAFNLPLKYRVTGGTGKYARATGKGTVNGWSYTTPTSPKVTELLRWHGDLITRM